MDIQGVGQYKAAQLGDYKARNVAAYKALNFGFANDRATLKGYACSLSGQFLRRFFSKITEIPKTISPFNTDFDCGKTKKRVNKRIACASDVYKAFQSKNVKY